MLSRVVISDRAYTAMLSEVQEFPHIETGGVFLGHQSNGACYIIEALNPGPNSKHQAAYFEYDDTHLNYLMDKISSLYKVPMRIVGLWHRHPGDFNQFSGTDDKTNRKYAARYPDYDGAVSALVNIHAKFNPKFKITMYHVTLSNSVYRPKYREIPVSVGNRSIPPEFLEYMAPQYYLNKIYRGEGETKSSPLDGVGRVGEILKKQISNVFSNRSGLTFSFGRAVQWYLDKRGHKVEFRGPFPLSEKELNLLLEKIQADLDYFESAGIGLSLSISKTGGLDLREKGPALDNSPVLISFFVQDSTVYFNHNHKTYRYIPGTFQSACEQYEG